MPLGFQLSRSARLPLRRIWQRLAIASNWPVLAAVAVLCAVGVLTIHYYGQSQVDPRLATLGYQQLKYIGIAMLCLLAIQIVNYQAIGRLAFVFYAVSFLPLIYTVIGSSIGGDHPLPGVSNVNGAYNWIRVAGISIQPAELMKVAFIMALARYLRYRENYRTWIGLIPPFALCAAPMILILKQPDLGTALVFGPTLMAMLFVAGAKMKHLSIIIAAALLLMPIAWFSGKEGTPVLEHFPSLIKKYQRDRIEAMFRDDAKTRQDAGYQQRLALTAFGSGGVSGQGIGNMPIGKDVPEGQNDMIFALIGEQFGFVGSAVVLIAYCVLLAAGVEIAGATREPFGRLVAVGLVAVLAAQAFINIAVSIKLMPVTGVTLPFISAGGSSLIASFMAAGLLLNIGQHRPLVMAEDSFEFGD